MKVILAEKPSVARTIASVVGASTRKDGYFEGNDYQVTWAIGHLVGLSMPKAYGYEKWSLNHLPIIPQPFKLEIIEDPSIKKQFKVIESLFKNCKEIIVATDAGREGELIYRYIHLLAIPAENVTIKRLWISDLTDNTIRKGLEQLRPIAEFDLLYHAARARSEADWLVGINFTQGYTLASGKGKPLSIGRVQTATLRLIVDRYSEHTSFQSTAFFIPKITLEDPNKPFVLSCEEKYKDRASAELLLNDLKDSMSAPIESTNKVSREKAPLLYDLTTLQRTANKVYKYTAKQTLDTAQALYERHKLVTYPRTDSQYLTVIQKPEIIKTFEKMDTISIREITTDSLKETCIKGVTDNPVFNNGKVTDHHAIIPTGKTGRLDDLSEVEKNLYLMIVQRFYQSFLPDCEKTTRRLQTIIGEQFFNTSSKQTLKIGWRVLSPEGEPEAMLPTLQPKECRTILETVIHEGMTKPKPIYTESSLLGSMETAGQFVQDKSLREGLKERGLGTPATRAAIIETLIKREYIIRAKGKLLPTEIGAGLINSIKELSVCSPELTGDWEFKLKQVERGDLAYEEFMSEIRSYVNITFPKLLESAQMVKELQTSEEKERDFSFGSCPKCSGGEIRKGKKSAYCTNWNADPKCNFTIWLSSFGKKLTDTQVSNLIHKRETSKLKGFKSKAGKPFSAQLVLDSEFKVKLLFQKK
ncbi:DNA topoisomerase III [Flagellimonas hymeniacidonis]|uniref:DNA topoisomerase n=1 Tax=Flagellimonas hymeniacidonis TaxID=2603628 RepID=A0A5C8V7N2_9FLAO|nr:type IA DNA topoisomerase [Flagellimonas hymeniacidonis]TXN37731.1 DNA topoisomerase III [Flagellimonas hymeniacidonis]